MSRLKLKGINKILESKVLRAHKGQIFNGVRYEFGSGDICAVICGGGGGVRGG